MWNGTDFIDEPHHIAAKADPAWVVEQCLGCANETLHGDDPKTCRRYGMPRAQWSRGRCPMASHVGPLVLSEAGKKLNPIKASKRGVKQ